MGKKDRAALKQEIAQLKAKNAQLQEQLDQATSEPVSSEPEKTDKKEERMAKLRDKRDEEQIKADIAKAIREQKDAGKPFISRRTFVKSMLAAMGIGAVTDEAVRYFLRDDEKASTNEIVQAYKSKNMSPAEQEKAINEDIDSLPEEKIPDFCLFFSQDDKRKILVSAGREFQKTGKMPRTRDFFGIGPEKLLKTFNESEHFAYGQDCPDVQTLCEMALEYEKLKNEGVVPSKEKMNKALMKVLAKGRTRSENRPKTQVRSVLNSGKNAKVSVNQGVTR